MEVKETPLSKIMQILRFRYTRYFNGRYRKEEHLFQGHYEAILCRKGPKSETWEFYLPLFLS
jgi:hypothetical protein